VRSSNPDLLASSIRTSLADAAATPYTDPLGSSTDVSLYYTPSVTGSVAWMVVDPTRTAEGEVETEKGQIVAPQEVSVKGAVIVTSESSGSRQYIGLCEGMCWFSLFVWLMLVRRFDIYE